MKLRRYVHNPLEVEALQVNTAAEVKSAFPRSHASHFPSGRLEYVHLVDAVGKSKAFPGEWILKHAGGYIEIVPNEWFQHAYGVKP